MYVTSWPNANGSPGAGDVVSVTFGVVLPTVIGTDADDVRPVRSVTFSVAS